MKPISQLEVKSLAKRSKKEELENSFLYHWTLLYSNLPAPERQVKFHPQRRWRWDFSWDYQDIKLAVEIQGGTWMKKGGHTTGSGIDKDYEKWREAVRLGWKVLPFSTSDMRNPAAVCDLVAEILCSAEIIEPT
jgi:very-short-patch-repair endonuclease